MKTNENPIKKGKDVSKKELYFFAKESAREFDENKKLVKKELEELKKNLKIFSPTRHYSS